MEADRKHSNSAYRSGSGGAPVSEGRGGQRYGGGRNGGGGGGGGGGRDRRPRDRDGRDQRTRNGRGKDNYVNSGAMITKPPIILARQEKRPEAPAMVGPGAVSIMQRESSGSHLPTSPPMLPPTSTGVFPAAGDPPMQTTHHPHSFPQMLKSRDEGKTRNQRRQENMSSSPSSYIPLQPGMRGGVRGDSGSGHSRSTAEHSVFLSPSSEMTHSIKLIDKNMHWEDRGVDYMLEQGDFLVVGVIGKQGVGKSTVMSLLAGTRTGAPKPFMFKTQSKDIYENGGYQTSGVDVVVTAERVVLLDTQPVLSDALLNQLSQNESAVPSGMSVETYLEITYLQLAMFLFSVCHVVLVVMDSLDSPDVLFRFLWTAEQMKSNCLRQSLDGPDVQEKNQKEFFSQLVFIFNHASPDDFQPFSLRETHLLLADNFSGAKFSINGGVSLFKSGIVPIGKGFPVRKGPKSNEKIDPGDVNLHLLPTNPYATDTFGVYTVSKPENNDTDLNPILKLLTSYMGHPSYTLLSETFRNQIFSMPRPPLCRTTQQQQQVTERDWFEYARRTWVTLKKSDLLSEYQRLLHATRPS